MNGRKLLLLLLVLAGVLAFFAFDLQRYLSLDELKRQQAALADLYAREPTSWSTWPSRRCRCRGRPCSRWLAVRSSASWRAR
jgi:hypothetical protein